MGSIKWCIKFVSTFVIDKKQILQMNKEVYVLIKTYNINYVRDLQYF